MDYLWSPWRFHYVASVGQKTGCVFCRLISESNDAQNLVLLRKNHNVLMLNKFPYTAGHLMIVARRHLARLAESSAAELNEMIQLARQCEGVLEKTYNPDGFNVGLNLGSSAGAGVAGHLHLHIVPRWEGDANFVSVVGETRVIPEDLDATYQRLHPYFHASRDRSNTQNGKNIKRRVTPKPNSSK